MRLGKTVLGAGKWLPRLCTLKNKLDMPKTRQYMMIKAQNQWGIKKKPCCPKIIVVCKYISAVKKL